MIMVLIDVVLAAPNHSSPGQRQGCSTVAIDNDRMALMLCPSVLSAPTLMGHFHAYNAILQAIHTMRRQDMELAATPNLASSGQRQGCSIVATENDPMALMLCLFSISTLTLMGHYYSLNALLQVLHTIRK